MAQSKRKPLSALFVTLTLLGLFLSSCDKEGEQSPVNQNETVVDEFTLNRASSRLCTTGLKLRNDDRTQDLDFNNLVSTGQAKALTFSSGTEECAIKLTTYDVVTRTNSTTGTLSYTPPGSSAPVQYNYTVRLVNTEPTSCITNGAAWEIQSTNSTNTNQTQIILKGLTDSQSSSFIIETDKLVKVSVLNEQLGLAAYTCQ